MNNFYENYLNDLSKIITKSEMSDKFNSLQGKSINEEQILQKGQAIIPKEEKVLAKFDFSNMAAIFGKHKYTFQSPTFGRHPDFTHLKHHEIEYHYAVSMFLDIKGSTRLAKKYDLLQIRQIKDTILTLSIQVCSFFGGHIQRLQGDGIFVYFVRRNQYKNDAIINAINASAMLCFFMKYQLPKIFEKEEIEPPEIRIGIDYGDKERVLWSHYGLLECNELTTTSLHTDLAAKLQQEASSNGIMLGDNVIKELDLNDKFITDKDEVEYIFSKYKMWEFNWENYLTSFDFFKRVNQRLEIDIPQRRIVCEVYSDTNERFIYPQNLYSIPKDYKLIYSLHENNHLYVKRPYEKIEWTVYNSGIEAKNAGHLNHDLQKKFVNLTTAETVAKYLGHHYIECKISAAHTDSYKTKFPVFIR